MSNQAAINYPRLTNVAAAIVVVWSLIKSVLVTKHTKTYRLCD